MCVSIPQYVRGSDRAEGDPSCERGCFEPLRRTDEGRALRCRFRTGKAAEPPERRSILQRFRQLDVRQACQAANNSARNNGDPIASPRGAAYTTDNRASLSDQSMRSAIASNDERGDPVANNAS